MTKADRAVLTGLARMAASSDVNIRLAAESLTEALARASSDRDLTAGTSSVTLAAEWLAAARYGGSWSLTSYTRH